MNIKELTDGLDITVKKGKTVKGDPDVKLVTVDSRETGEHTVFCPILGYRLNGSDFIDEAYRRGCRIFMSETDAEPKPDCIILKTKNLRKSVAELSYRINGIPSKRIDVIGVTGTKGKTGIAFTLGKILSSVGIPTYSIGTLGVIAPDGSIVMKTENTTPEPTRLFRMISDCADLGGRALVIEVSSQALKDYRIYGLEFFAVIFSSLGMDHIGKGEHDSFTEYLEAKRSLFTDYKSKFKIINGDDQYASYISFGTEKCIKCGFGLSADFCISDFSATAYGSRFKLNGVELNSQMIAKYDCVNTSLAIAAAVYLSGKSISEIGACLAKVRIPGRYERYRVKGRTFIIDYAHNRLSFTSVFELTRKHFKGRIIAVFGSVGDRSYGRRRELAEIAERYADFSVITSDNPGYESAENICEEIASFFHQKTKFEIVVDRERAIHRAYELSWEGDVILLLGKGHERHMEFMGEKIPFCESDIIEKISRER